MTLTAWGLAADLFGVVLLAASTPGWYEYDDGSREQGSWMSHGPIGQRIGMAGGDPYKWEERVNKIAWFLVIGGFLVQLLAEINVNLGVLPT